MKTFTTIMLMLILGYAIAIDIQVKRTYKIVKEINTILTKVPMQLIIEPDTLNTERAWEELNKAYIYKINHRYDRTTTQN